MMLSKNGIHDSVLHVTEEDARHPGNSIELEDIHVEKTSDKKMLWVRFKPSNNGSITFHNTANTSMVNSIEERGPMIL